jgi:CheY-like chemotaxis protein
MEPATVLIVDDQPTVLSPVVAILGRAGFKVLSAGSAERALRICREQSLIEVALIDVLMPGMDGLEIRKTLVTEFPEIHVLLMSGYSREGISSGESGVVAAEFIQKPFPPRILVDRVRVAMEGLPRPS